MNHKPQTYWLAEPISAISIVSQLSEVGEAVFDHAQKTESEYFDTFDWRLFEAGKSLRVKNTPGGSEIELFDADCPEANVASQGQLPTGFATDFAAGDLRDILEPIIEVRRLFPCLSVTSTATPVSILDNEGKTVLRVLHEHIDCRRPNGVESLPLGDRAILRPVRGYPKPLRKARRILERMSCRKANGLSLAAMGLEAIGAKPGDYSSKLRIELDPGMTAGAASRRIHLTLLDAMERNEAGAAKNLDSEFLHDFRVAVRRTRSALSQIDKEILPVEIVAKAKEDFRWIGRQTNQMRDLDVYLIAFPAFKAALPDDYRASLDPLRDHLARRSHLERKNIAALVSGKHYRQIRDGWRNYIEQSTPSADDGGSAMLPVKSFADANIWKTYRRLVRDGKAIDDDSPPETLHDLRLRSKKLRYLMEFFQSLYPQRQIGVLVSTLKKLQNVLGEFQDAEIQCLAIRQFALEMSRDASGTVETQMAMGMVADTILKRQKAARSAFADRFAEFSRASARKSFARLFRP